MCGIAPEPFSLPRTTISPWLLFLRKLSNLFASVFILRRIHLLNVVKPRLHFHVLEIRLHSRFHHCGLLTQTLRLAIAIVSAWKARPFADAIPVSLFHMETYFPLIFAKVRQLRCSIHWCGRSLKAHLSLNSSCFVNLCSSKSSTSLHIHDNFTHNAIRWNYYYRKKSKTLHLLRKWKKRE